MPLSENEIEAIADRVAKKLQNETQSKEDNVLLTAQQCADLMHYNKKYFLNNIASIDDFPKREYPKKNGRPMWNKNAVIEYCNRSKSQNLDFQTT
jgi:hypothetical protein